MKTHELNAALLVSLRGKRSREVIAHELRKRGHGTDAKSIWRYETGRSQPNARILPDLAEVLGAESVDELYSSDDESEAAMPAVPAHLRDDYALFGALALRLITKARSETGAARVSLIGWLAAASLLIGAHA